MNLVVSTDIPYGNACDVTLSRRHGMPVVEFEADPHGGPTALWFCLRIVADRTSSRAKNMLLCLKNPDNLLGGHDPASMCPVIRYAEGDWHRLPRGQREMLADGRYMAVWETSIPKEYADVAFCFPYGLPEVTKLVDDCTGYWSADTIGVSQGGRPLIRLSNGYGSTGDDRRPGFYFTARQHSGETPGSWVLDGLLRKAAEMGEAAPLIWAVPLTNIDGVEQGDYGKDNFPYDLNRAWGQPPMRYETQAFMSDMKRWKERCRPQLCIDFHAPGGCETEGAYCFMPDPETNPSLLAETTRWLGVVERAVGHHAHDPFGRVARYKSRWETPGISTWCRETLGVPILCMETPYSVIHDVVMTREEYREIGAAIALALAGQTAE